MFTGMETAASAAQVAKAAKSCCDGCPHNEDPTPQSAPSCPTFLCLSVDLVEPVFPPVVFLKTITLFTFKPTPIPDPFIQSIFHPPSIV